MRAQENRLSEIEMANALQSLRQAIETRNRTLLSAIATQWIERTELDDGEIINQ